MIAALLALAQLSAVTQVRDSYPSLSPDGRQLVFSSNRSGSAAIWLADAEGTKPRLLFDGGSLGSDPATAVWSPDGARIAFAMRPAGSVDENESEIYVMRADGSAVRRLTNAPGDDSHPHWSADGRRIFFNSARATSDLKADWSRQWIDIYSMASDGSDVRRHTDCRTVCTYPVPSPDGRSIAFRKVTDTPGLQWDLEPGRRNSEIFVAALDGSNPVNVSNGGAYDGWPMWSPGGRWLVFASNRDKATSTGQIYAVRPDGSQMKALTSGTLSRAQPSFSPDGKTLYVYESVESAGFEIGHIASIPIDLRD
jgi:TolB protein